MGVEEMRKGGDTPGRGTSPPYRREGGKSGKWEASVGWQEKRWNEKIRSGPDPDSGVASP